MHGLVLEGGGAKGSYHIGVYKALIEEGIEIKGVAGTSVGALNGAMIVQGDFEKAYDIWHEISYSKIFNTNEDELNRVAAGKLSKEDISYLIDSFRGFFTDKGLDIAPLKNLLIELIDEEKIRNSGKDFGIVTVSLTDLKPLEIYIEDIPSGQVVEYLMASAYLPVFKTERIDGKKYIDGGIYNNLPVNLLKNKGYKDLILVRTHAPGVVRRINSEGLNIITISPKDNLGKVLDFDRETVRHNIKLGYFDALRALRGLKGHHYYIEPIKGENYVINYLLDLDEERIFKLKELFKVDSIPNNRALFEFIIPKVAAILGVEKEADYEDIFIFLLDKLAEIYELERFKIYCYDELLNLVKENLNLEKNNKTSIIDRIIEKVDLLTIFTKGEIIKEVGKIIL
ncbi:patatin-like phospholipase family protein [Schnuerera sp.]|uniref:patatin-like phospholipase family protein n=1 Tax=Schnuerera sp. TaxID=2794844 RepID=UPI002C3B5D14|nr:patatin-like phospholipase family protein [Schnuerera sp.]HSH35221.1 patatin-like phospholipase family protein [Schnuerera sp.]